MASLNKVFMIGRLTKDPEVRYLPNGTPKAELRLATSRQYKDKNGEKQEDTCYVDVVVWSRQAELAGQYLQKGRQVFIEGRLDYQEWESQEGQKRSKHQVVAERVQFLDSRGGGGGGAPDLEGEMREEGSFEGAQAGNGPAKRGGYNREGGYGQNSWGKNSAGKAQTYGHAAAGGPAGGMPGGAPAGVPHAGVAVSDSGPQARPLQDRGPQDRPMAEAMGVNDDDVPF
jgi:single-strand DNA-binding protein